MKRFWLVLVILLATVAAGSSARPEEKRGPSTPEERALAVKLARFLETNPLGEEAKEARSWLTIWLIEIPDITVRFCIFPPFDDLKKVHDNEIVTQFLYSGAAFIIENPNKAKDDQAVYLAGTEGALKVYKAILEQQPEVRQKGLDELLVMNNVDLAKYVRKVTKKTCK